MIQPTFTPESLVMAIQTLFEQNNYRVEGPLKIHGAEVDLKVTSNSDPFAPNIYIEATVERVSNEKYGKDATKFLLLRAKEPNATLLCVSSEGFSLPVRERSLESGIQTLTYNELFAKFQRFTPYINNILIEGEVADDLQKLDIIYEESRFEDVIGNHTATEFLSSWRAALEPVNSWVVVVGDYGTGKTALSKVLLRRWMLEYQKNPSLSIPFRIELRDFTRQFDARGLLHHFLDNNNLGHLPVDFVVSLIRQGRIVLLLDGYDEMAQYMHARERRACLGALAELARDGARGILTSRPNYFTEAEELNLLDALYTSLSEEGRISRIGRNIIEREQALDSLLKNQFIDRYERFLKDLDPTQTKNLIRKALTNDPVGQEAVIRILDLVFRSTEEGSSVSLSGKPVIISYLLAVVEELKSNPSSIQHSSGLTEWQVYALIMDNLMWRDYNRAPEILPRERRGFLQSLSMYLSSQQSATVDENTFVDFVRKSFQNQLRRFPEEAREQELQKIFADLRSSATLTRRVENDKFGWRFSHNSLREFLASEHLVSQLLKKDAKIQRINVSDVMRMFALSLSREEREQLLNSLAELYSVNSSGEVLGMYLAFLWDAAIRLFHDNPDPVSAIVSRVFSKPASLNGISISRLDFFYNGIRAALPDTSFVAASLNDVDFDSADLPQSNFESAIIEGVSFRDANLQNANFKGALLIEVDLTGADVKGANFQEVAGISGVRTASGLYNDESAIGYVAFMGAKTSSIDAIYICLHHPKYTIAEKIARKLYEQPTRQKRGLIQRGAANQDQGTARDFLRYLMANGIVDELGGREDIVRTTAEGRGILRAFCEREKLDRKLYRFFDINI